MKKRLLPRAWHKQILLRDNEEQYEGFVDFYARLGRFMSCDDDAVLDDDIYILPCISFSFSHSKALLRFAWLNFYFVTKYKSFKREDAYREKMIRKVIGE